MAKRRPYISIMKSLATIATYTIIFLATLFLLERIISSFFPPWDWRQTSSPPGWLYLTAPTSVLLAMFIAGIVVGWLFRVSSLLVASAPVVSVLLFLVMVLATETILYDYPIPPVVVIVAFVILALPAAAASAVGARLGDRLRRRA